MPIVNLRFTGLCGFVPKKGGYAANNQVRVLLVNAGPLPGGGAYGGHEAHIPVLRCEAKVVVTAGTDPNGRPLRGPDFTVGGESFFALSEQDVEITGASKDQLSFTYGAGGTGCHSAPDLNNCDWLAKIATLGGSGAVRPGCFATGGSVDAGVAARVALTQGKLRNYSLAVDATLGRVVHWEFKTAAGGSPITRTQALSEAMEYEYSAAGTSVDLETSLMPGRAATSAALRKIFGAGVFDRWIRLDAGGGAVNAWIVNVPLADLFGVRPEALVGSRGVDHHFELYYDLLSTPGTRRIPWPLPGRCNGSGGPSAGNPQCPGNEYDSDGAA